MPLMGTGGLGSRIWSGPAITVIAIDVPSVDEATYTVSPYARAILSVRVHPEQDATEAQAAEIQHLRQTRPFGIEVEVRPGLADDGFSAATTGPAYRAAGAAWMHAWGVGLMMAGCGALSRSSMHSRAPCRTPRYCWSAPPMETQTSVARTNASCSTSSKRRWSPEQTSLDSTQRRFAR